MNQFKDKVSETLLIPLYMRAKESSRADAIIHDPIAQRIVESIEYDYSKFDTAKNERDRLCHQMPFLRRHGDGICPKP